MIAIGIGANSKAELGDFAAALAEVCRNGGGTVVATFEQAPYADMLKNAATRHGLIYRELPLAELRRRDCDCHTRSARTLALFGFGSVAEASALAAAGSGSHLLAARRIVGPVTIAAAQSARSEEGAQ